MGPPPAPPALQRVPCEWGACYSREDAAKLGLWSAAIWRWAQDAHACQQETP